MLEEEIKAQGAQWVAQYRVYMMVMYEFDDHTQEEHNVC